MSSLFKQLLYLFVVLITSTSVLAAEQEGLEDSLVPTHSIAKNPEIRSHKIEPLMGSSRYLGADGGAKNYQIPLSSFLIHQPQKTEVTSFVITKDGLGAFSGSRGGAVVRSSLIPYSKTSNKVRSIESDMIMESNRPILALSLSADERYLAVSQTSRVFVIDLVKREVEYKLTRLRGRISAMDWDPRGELLLLGLANGEIYAWNLSRGKHAGKDDLRALEKYASSKTPIQKLKFNPSGRTFFSADRSGGLYLWRLLRTDYEMGLREQSTSPEVKQSKPLSSLVAGLGPDIEDFYLDSESSRVFVAGSDGLLYRWKVRGLKPLPPFIADSNGLAAVAGVSVVGENQASVLFTTGKTNNLRLWCNSPDLNKQTLLTASKQVAAELGNKLNPLAETMILENSILSLVSRPNSPVLWASLKGGKLLSFDLRLLSKRADWPYARKFCA